MNHSFRRGQSVLFISYLALVLTDSPQSRAVDAFRFDLAGRFHFDSSSSSHRPILEQNGILFVREEHSINNNNLSRLLIIDFSNPDVPQLLGEYPLANDVVDSELLNGHLYLAEQSSPTITSRPGFLEVLDANDF